MLNETPMYRKRAADWSPYDSIQFAIVPRFKTSGLSGDMWRTSVCVTWSFKGVVTFQRSYTSMETALLLFTGDYLHEHWAVPDAVIEIEKTACDQPGCNQKSVGRFKLKRETAPQGEWLDPTDRHGDSYRQFCLMHVERGDASREDADDNYIPLDKAGPTRHSQETRDGYSSTTALVQATEARREASDRPGLDCASSIAARSRGDGRGSATDRTGGMS